MEGPQESSGIPLGNLSKILSNNPYKLWNRLCSGSYFPPPVKSVAIPKKKSGGECACWVCQRWRTGWRKRWSSNCLNPSIDQSSITNSAAIVRALGARCDYYGEQRAGEYDWVVEFDIKGLFDNIDHELLLHVRSGSTVRCHGSCCTSSVGSSANANAGRRTCGKDTGHRKVVSSVALLANLFLHYAFDSWVGRHLRSVRICRYADDGVMHCRSLAQAKFALARLVSGFVSAGSNCIPRKPRSLYCRISIGRGFLM